MVLVAWEGKGGVIGEWGCGRLLKLWVRKGGLAKMLLCFV